MRSDQRFARGAWIVGKWQRHAYQIVGFLGEGANGKVYLVRRDGGLYALKIGFSTFDLQSEINVLKLIQTNRDKKRYFIEADDFHHDGEDIPFYVMAYIQGVSCAKYLTERGMEWFYIIGKKILEELAHLHEQGWVFGDLNENNVMVYGYGEVALIDYGGVTSQGRSVKQFTQYNDRGYWQAGTRTADDGYDLFSFVLLCLQSIDKRYTSLLTLQHRHVDHIVSLLETNPYCEPMLPFFRKALAGEYRSSREACHEWRQLMLRRKMNDTLIVPVKWLKGAFVASAVTLASTLYFIFQ